MRIKARFTNLVQKIRKLRPMIRIRKKIPQLSNEPKKFSIRPSDMVREMHQIIDFIKYIQTQNCDRNLVLAELIEHLAAFRFIQEQIPQEFARRKRTIQLKSQAIQFARWVNTGMTKMMKLFKQDEMDPQDAHQVMLFTYESLWKLIVLFEEGIGISCSTCKTNARSIVYPFSTDGSYTSHTYESKLIEKELIDLIEQAQKT